MANSLSIDTLAVAKRLREAGVPEKQAEAHAETLAEIVEERVATKRDLKELEIALKRDFKELETNLKRDLIELEMRLSMKLTLRMGTMLAASIAIITALVKLL